MKTVAVPSKPVKPGKLRRDRCEICKQPMLSFPDYAGLCPECLAAIFRGEVVV